MGQHSRAVIDDPGKASEPGTCDRALITRIQDEILPLFDAVIRGKESCFNNPHVVHCLKSKPCTREACPAYNNPTARCWQVAGTYCGGEVQGALAHKYGSCRTCDVFMAACPTIVEELGENLNNLVFILRLKEHLTRSQLDKIQELLCSLEDLDIRNRQIQELVITDRLTGLYNRHYLMTTLADEISRCQRRANSFALMMIDVDDFKSVNDTHGHLFGDLMLAYLGGLLREHIRKHDRAFRYGGEEFVVVLPDADITIAWMVAERIRTLFQEKQFTDGAQGAPVSSLFRTLSIGIARYEPDSTPEVLLRQADNAMYKAKSHGKNRVSMYGINETTRTVT